MRSIDSLLTSALTAALLLAGAAAAQPPAPPPGPVPDLVGPPINVDDIVERILSFDKDKKGKVTRADLPERMQFLIDLGDTNKDGALDKEEIRKLAVKLASGPGGLGGVRGDVRIGGSFGGGPRPGGPGPVGFGVSIRGGDSNALEVVDDLKLSAKKKEQALATVKAHEEHVRKMMEQSRTDLLEKMKGILSEEEFQDFKAALDRPRASIAIEALPDGPRPGEGERRTGPRP
jgi:hypothetical protein